MAPNVTNWQLHKRIVELEEKLETLEAKLDPIIQYNQELSYANNERRLVLSCDASVNPEEGKGAVAWVITYPDNRIKEQVMDSFQTDSNLAELDAVYQAIQFIQLDGSLKDIRAVEIRTDNESVNAALNNQKVSTTEIFARKAKIIREDMFTRVRYPIIVLQKKRRSTFGLQLADRLCRNRLRELCKVK